MLDALATSDWHFGGQNVALGHDATDRQLREIRKVYEYAAEHGIKHIFVPGDISDTSKLDDHTLISLISLILEFETIKTHYVLGNHDMEHIKKTSLDVLHVLSERGLFKNFKVYNSPAVVKIEGISCCMLPFPNLSVLKTSKPALVFAHVETPGAVGDNGHVLRGTDKLIRQTGDYVISGHIHQHQILKKKRFMYVGSLYQKNFGEALPKGFIRLRAKYVSGKLVVTTEFVNSVPNFVLQTKVINEISDWDSLKQDDNIRYKILVGEGIIVPRDLVKDFPNIVYINGASSRVKVTTDGQTIEGGVGLNDLPAFKITTGLTKYLKSASMNVDQVKRAKVLVKEAQRELSIT